MAYQDNGVVMRDGIILGDAYELIKSVPDKSVDLIVTDPPYLIEPLTGGPMIAEAIINYYNNKNVVNAYIENSLEF